MAENLRMFLSGLNIPTFSMPRFGLNSILDILFLSFAIYKLLMWINQTRVWTPIKGLVVLVVVYTAAYILGLDTTVWIISKSASVALIAVLILFQQEFRKALEILGKGKIGSLLSIGVSETHVIKEQTIDEIVDACVKLSKMRTGALIVIEQDVAVGDWETTGIKIDAVVTSQLIINIFEDKTPLHDGAILVRDNRVSAATCILPLTGDHLSSELGTRHRAAVGASELSDAYVIVVSEETGCISVAKEGKLRRNLTSDDMHRILTENSKPARESKPTAKKGRQKSETK